jgi:hypothetical protein
MLEVNPEGRKEVSSLTFFHHYCHYSLEIAPVTEFAGMIDWIFTHQVIGKI